MNNERTRPKTYASDAIEEILNSRYHRRTDNWLLSYLDVFVLVVMLMVTLLSLTENKKIPVKKSDPKVSNPSIRPNSNTNLSAMVKVPMATTPLTGPEVAPKATDDAEQQTLAAEKRLQTELEAKLKSMGLNNAVALRVSKGYAQIDIQNKVLFRSSEAELTDAGKELLSGILPMLKESDGLIIIEGHTDNRPIHTTRFPSNWELSSSRATSVLHFLASQQLDLSRLHTSGFADTKPVADNTTPEGREKNRRVNIMIKVEDKLQQLDISN